MVVLSCRAARALLRVVGAPGVAHRPLEAHAADLPLGAGEPEVTDLLVKQRLDAFFQPHNEAFFEFIGRRIPSWGGG